LSVNASRIGEQFFEFLRRLGRLSFDISQRPINVVAKYLDLFPGALDLLLLGITVILTPQQPLLEGEAYTVTLKGGVNAPHITDAKGTPLVADFTWSITKLFR
jgi:hypothetical protein